MSLMSLPRMVVSDTEGWTDILRLHPSLRGMLLGFVVPMSLLPPLMHAYSQLVYPGVVFGQVEPALTWQEAALIGSVFFVIELLMVALMASYIQQLGEIADVQPSYAAAYTLAAIAPTPLWLSALSLFVPSFGFNVLMVVLAWGACVALIRHGVPLLMKLDDPQKAHRLSNFVTFAGVCVWIGMVMLFSMLLGILVGWR